MSHLYRQPLPPSPSLSSHLFPSSPPILHTHSLSLTHTHVDLYLGKTLLASREIILSNSNVLTFIRMNRDLFFRLSVQQQLKKIEKQEQIVALAQTNRYR